MKWIKYYNSFSLLDPLGKCGLFRLSLGVCPTEPARCGVLSGVLSVWWKTSASVSALFQAVLPYNFGLAQKCNGLTGQST